MEFFQLYSDKTAYIWMLFLIITLLFIRFLFAIVKVDREKQLVCVDELLDEISVDELQEQLPGETFILKHIGKNTEIHSVIIIG